MSKPFAYRHEINPRGNTYAGKKMPHVVKMQVGQSSLLLYRYGRIYVTA